MSPNTLRKYIGKYIIKVSQDFEDLKPFFDEHPLRISGQSQIVEYDGVFCIVRPLLEEDFENFEFIKSLASNWTLRSLEQFLTSGKVRYSFNR